MAVSPLVSVCIPAYKQVEFLRRTLQSLIEQDEKRWELIVTDDSREDDVKNLLKEFDFDGRLRYFHNEKQLGSPANWNAALRYAQAPYVKLMHHDDWFAHPGSLREYMNMLRDHPAAYVAFAATTIYNAKDQSLRLHCPTALQLEKLKEDPRILFYGNFIGAPSAVIVRKDSGICYDEKVSYVVDIDFYIHLLQKFPHFIFSEKPLIVNVSEWEQQITHHALDASQQIREYTYLYNKIWRGSWPSRKALLFFRQLFLKYRIKNKSQLRSLGASMPRPGLVFAALLFYLRMKGRYRNG